MGTTSSCTPVSMLVSLWLCITTSVPILQLFAFDSSEEEMCQQVPSASVAMPPLFIAHRVVFFDAIVCRPKLLAPPVLVRLIIYAAGERGEGAYAA